MGMQPDHRSKQVPDQDRSTRGDKVARREIFESGGLQGNQSGEANWQIAGRRTTAGIVKVKHRESLSEMLNNGTVERPFDTRRPSGILKELGESRDTAHGVKGDDILGKISNATGESPEASAEADKPRYKVEKFRGSRIRS